MSGQYQIVAAQYNIQNSEFYHNTLLLEDPNGNVIGSLNGLSQNNTTGYLGAASFFGGAALASIFSPGEYAFQGPTVALQPAIVAGSLEQIMVYWNAMVTAAAAINASNPSYPTVLNNGTSQANSNSVFSDLLAVIGYAWQNLGLSTTSNPGLGLGSQLLTPPQAQSIQSQFGITPQGISNANPPLPFLYVPGSGTSTGSWQISSGGIVILAGVTSDIQFKPNTTSGTQVTGGVLTIQYPEYTSIITSVAGGIGSFNISTTVPGEPLSGILYSKILFQNGTTINTATGQITPATGQSVSLVAGINGSQGLSFTAPAGQQVAVGPNNSGGATFAFAFGSVNMYPTGGGQILVGGLAVPYGNGDGLIASATSAVVSTTGSHAAMVTLTPVSGQDITLKAQGTVLQVPGAITTIDVVGNFSWTTGPTTITGNISNVGNGWISAATGSNVNTISYTGQAAITEQLQSTGTVIVVTPIGTNSTCSVNSGVSQSQPCIIQLGSSCFPAGTRIRMANGIQKPIETLRTGDVVAAFDPNAGAGLGPLLPATVARVFSNEMSDLVRVNGWFVLTPGHRVLSSDGRFIEAGQLVAGRDHLVLQDGTFEPIRLVEPLHYRQPTYNFEVSGLHTYVAQGVRVHNDSIAGVLPPGVSATPLVFENGLPVAASYTDTLGNQVTNWETLDSATGLRTSLVSQTVTPTGIITTFSTYQNGAIQTSGTITSGTDQNPGSPTFGQAVASIHITGVNNPSSPIDLTVTPGSDGTAWTGTIVAINGVPVSSGLASQLAQLGIRVTTFLPPSLAQVRGGQQSFNLGTATTDQFGNAVFSVSGPSQTINAIVRPDGSSSVQYFDTSSGSPVLNREVDTYPEGNSIISDFNGNGTEAGATFVPATGTGQTQNFDGGAIATALGSELGNILANGNALEAIPLSVALGVTLGSFANIVKNAAGGNVTNAIGPAFANVPNEVASLGAGAIADYLSAELLNAVGIKGPAAQAISTAAGAAVGTIASNLTTLALASGPVTVVVNGQSVPLQWDTNVVTNIEDGVAGFVGSELASLVLPASSEDSAIGGELGGAAGAVAGVAVGTSGTIFGIEFGAELGSWAGPIGAAVGAFVGAIVGTLAGGLFGPGKGTPFASSLISVSPTGLNSATFQAGAVVSKHAAPVAFVNSLAATTVESLNAILADIGGKVAASGAVTPFQIGVWNGVIGLIEGGVQQNFANAGQDLTYAVVNALKQIMQGGGIIGGDLYIKRALQAYLAAAQPVLGGPISGDLSTLTGDISVAQGYEQYVGSSSATDAAIVASPESVFAAGWLVTLQEADALGLDRRASTDWTGGWSGYLASFNVDPEQLTAAFRSNARLITVGTTTVLDTIASSAKDIITDTTVNDTISINATGTLQANSNVLFDGAAATTTQVSSIAAVIYAGPGNAVVYAGGQGDDVVGYTGVGYGNELLVAGWSNGNGSYTQSLNATWLFAGAGNDTLEGGASGGDMLEGGAGNDLMQAGIGSTLFIGGSGNDTMDGSGAGDIFQVGVGTHTTIINLGTGSAANTIVFGIGDGAVTVNPYGGSNGELSMGAGISWTNLQVAESGNNLVITVTNNGTLTSDSITLTNWFSNAYTPTTPYPIDELRFSDGSEVQLSAFHFEFTSISSNNLVLTPGTVWAVAGPGNDNIDGWMSGGIIDAGVGDDSVSGGTGAEVIMGSTGNDTLFGGLAKTGHDYIVGGAGDDLIMAGSLGDTMVAGVGSDTFVGGGGNDLIEYALGDGADTIFNPLTLATATEVTAGGTWVNGFQWTYYTTGAADGGGYWAITNGTATVLDTRTFGTSPNGIEGYLEYNRTSENLYWWSAATAATATKGTGDSILQLGSGISASNLVFQQSGNNLVMGIRANGDLSTPVSELANSITFASYFTEGTAIQTIEFADGTSLTLNPGSLFVSTSDAAQTVAATGAIPAAGALVYGGAGNDTLLGGAGAETIMGGGGNNLLEAGSGADLLEAGNGNDTFVAGVGNDTFAGGAGFNTVSFINAGSAVVAVLSASVAPSGVVETGAAAGDTFTNIQTVISSPYSDTIYGGAGATTFNASTSSSADDALYGYSGNDSFMVHSTGSVTIFATGGAAGSTGNNNLLILDQGQALSNLSFSANGSAGLNITYQTGTPAQPGVPANYLLKHFFQTGTTGIGTGNIAYLETANGLDLPLGNIVLNGTATGSVSAMLVGNITTNGVSTPIAVLNASASSGNDMLLGATGNDTLIGGAGDDTFEGGTGSNVMQGGTAGVNTVIYTDEPGAVNVNLATGTVTNGYGYTDTLSNIQDVIGSATGNDTIRGGAANSFILAGNGNVLILGGSGADTLIGGTGADTIYGGTGAGSLIEANAANGTADTTTHLLIGQGGNDTLYGGSTAGDDIIASSTVTALVYGGPGYDTITGGIGNDTIYTGLNGALVQGGAGNTLVEGGAGNDAIYAGNGFDTLDGGGGSNLLYAGTGDDTLTNSTGDDTFYGGSGRDTFVVDSGSSSTLIVAPTGVHDLLIQDPSASQPLSTSDIWLARQGNSLVVSVIGATAQVTIQNFFDGPNPPTVRRIVVGDQQLFLDQLLSNGANLLSTMSSTILVNDPLDARGVPTSMPVQVTPNLATYWSATSSSTADVLILTGQKQTMTGGAGDNLIEGSAAGDDTLIAGPANDTLEGATGGNWLEAGTGNALIEGGAGANMLIGGPGNDTLEGDAGAASTTQDADTLIAGTGNQVLVGGAGPSNTFETGTGSDTVEAAGLNSTIFIDGAGYDTIDGSIEAGSTTTVNYILAPSAIDVNVQNGGTNDIAGDYTTAWSTTDLFSGTVNGIVGSPYGGIITDSGTSNDLLVASDGAPGSKVYGTLINAAGSSGNDTLEAGAGNDTLIGGSGSTTLIAGLGDDLLEGGTGPTTYDLGAGFNSDTISNASSISLLSFAQNSTVGVNYEDLWFQDVGNNLVITDIANDDQVTVLNWFGVPVMSNNVSITAEIQLITALQRYTQNVNVGALVKLMAQYSMPTSIANLGSVELASPSYLFGLDTDWHIGAPTITVANGLSFSATEGQPLTITLDVGDFAAPLVPYLTVTETTTIQNGLSIQLGSIQNVVNSNGTVTAILSDTSSLINVGNVTFTVADSIGMTSSVVVSGTFAAVNVAPIFLASPQTQIISAQTAQVTTGFSVYEPDAGVSPSKLTASVSITNLSGTLINWLTPTLTSISTSISGDAAWNLAIAPNSNYHNVAGEEIATITVTNAAVAGAAPGLSQKSFYINVQPTIQPTISGISSTSTIYLYENSSTSIALQVGDLYAPDAQSVNVTETVTPNDPWLTASISGSGTAQTLILQAGSYEAGSAAVTLTATDAAGTITNIPLDVYVRPVDYAAAVTANPNGYTAYQYQPVTEQIGSISISNPNSGNAIAAADGFTSETFSVIGYYYDKNGVQVSGPSAPITIIQDPNNRSVAYIYPTNSSAFNYLSYDTIFANIQGLDSTGTKTNEFNINIGIPDPHIWPIEVASVTTQSVEAPNGASYNIFTVDASIADNSPLYWQAYDASTRQPLGSLEQIAGGQFTVDVPYSYDNLYFTITNNYTTYTDSQLLDVDVTAAYSDPGEAGGDGGNDPLLPGYNISTVGSIWLRSVGSLVEAIAGGKVAAVIDPLLPYEVLSLSDGSVLSQPSINALLKVMDLYTALTGNIDPSPSLLAQTAAGQEVLQAESLYWTPPPAGASLSDILNPGTTVAATASNQAFVVSGTAEVNWPPLNTPSWLPRPGSTPNILINTGTFQAEAISIDPTVAGPVFINGGTAFTQLSAGEGNDYLISSATNAVLTAGSGSDGLYAMGNGSTLIGGSGQDILASGTSTQNVLFIAGSGQDTITGSGTNATASFASASAGVSINLVTGALSGAAAGDVLSGINNIVGATDYNNILTGGTSANLLIGGAGNDVLTTGLGNDTLVGGGGNDSYVLNPSAGQDTVINGIPSSGMSDTPDGALALGKGLSLSQLWFTQTGTNLLVQVLGTLASATVEGWYANPYAQLEYVTQANDTSFTTPEIANLAIFDSAYQAAVPGFKPQTGNASINLAAGTSIAAGTVANAILIGLDNATLTSTSSGDWLAMLGNNGTVTTGSGDSIYVGGTGDSGAVGASAMLTLAATSLNNGITIGNYGTAIENGVSNTVHIGSGAAVTQGGTANIVNANSGATGDIVTVGGIGDDVYWLNSSTVAVTGTGAGGSINANNTVTALAGSSGLNLTAGASTVLTDNGSNDVTAVGGGSTMTLGGSTNTGTILGSGTLAISGTSDTGVVGANSVISVTGTNDTVIGGSSDSVTNSGIGATITLGAGSSLINQAAGSVVVTYLSGGSFTETGVGASAIVNGNNVTVTMSAASSVTIGGDADTGTVAASGTLTFAATSLTNGITIGNYGTAIENGTSNTVYIGSIAAVTQGGMANIVKGNSGTTGDVITLGGSADLVYWLNSSTVTVTGIGAGGLINANDTVTALAGSSGMNLTAGANTVLTENGSNDGIYFGSNSTATLGGTGNYAAGSTGAIGDIVTVGGTGDGVYWLSSSTVTVTGTGGDGVINANDTVTALAGSSGLNLTTGANTVLTENGSNDGVYFGSNSTATLGGTGNYAAGSTGAIGDIVTVGGTGDGVYWLSSSTVTVTGTGGDGVINANDTVTALTGSSGLNLTTGANTVLIENGSNNGVWFGSNSAATLGGTGNSVVGNTGTIGDSVTVGGTGDDVYWLNSSTVTVTGTGAGGSINANNTVTALAGSSGMNLTAGANTALTDNGSNDVTSVGGGSTVTLGGSTNTSTILGSGTLAISGTNDTGVVGANGVISVSGRNDIVTGGSADTVTNTGIGTTVTLGAGSSLINQAAGSVAVTYLSGGSFTENGIASSAIVNGNSVAVTVSAASGVTIGGAADTGTIAASGMLTFAATSLNNGITIGNYGTAIENGTSNTVYIGSTAAVTQGGMANIVKANSGTTGDIISLGGTADLVYWLNNSTVTVTGTGDLGSINANNTVTALPGSSGMNLTAGASTVLTENGSNDGVYFGSNSTATLGGTGNYAAGSTGAIGDIVTVSGTGDGVYWLNSSTVTITGTGGEGVINANDTVTALTGSSGLNLTTGANTVLIENGSNNGVWFGSNSAATLGGTGNFVSGNTGITGDIVTVGGIGDDVYWLNSSTVIVTGTAAGGIINANNTVTALTGSSGLNLTAGVNTVLTDNGSNDVTEVGGGSTMTLGGSTNSGTILGSGTLAISGTSDTGVTGANSVISVTGTNDIVTGGSNDTVTDSGIRATFTLGAGSSVTDVAQGSSLSVTGSSLALSATGSAASLTVIGSTDTVIASGQNDIITLNGSNEAATLGVNARINLSNGSGDVITGTNDIVTETAVTAALSVNGSNMTVSAGSGDTITQTGSAVTMSFLNGGTVVQAGSTSSAILNSNSVIVWMSQTGGTATANGNYDTVTGGTSSAITINGSYNGASAGVGSTINVSGQNSGIIGSGMSIQATASNTTFWVSGTNDTVVMSTSGVLDIVNNGTFGIGFITGSSTMGVETNGAFSQTVSGFNMTNGDKLDLSQILAGTSVTASSLGSYVTASGSGSNTTLVISSLRGLDTVILSGSGIFNLQSLINGNAFVLPTH